MLDVSIITVKIYTVLSPSPFSLSVTFLYGLHTLAYFHPPMAWQMQGNSPDTGITAARNGFNYPPHVLTFTEANRLIKCVPLLATLLELL